METTRDYGNGDWQPKKEGLKDNISQLTESAKEKIGEVAEPVKEKAVEMAQQQKDAGADQIRIVARAVHGAASELETDMPQFAGYIHTAGDQLDQFASKLRNGSVNELFDSFTSFARNQPATVFGGALLAGIALSRFLKSSAPPNDFTAQPANYGAAGSDYSSQEAGYSRPQSDYPQDGTDYQPEPSQWGTTSRGGLT